MQDTNTLTNAEVWEQMQALRSVLEERGALCTNCGTLKDDERPHGYGSMGSCWVGQA